jgi:hypothetical protein
LRLKHKRSMQDREASRQRLLDADAAHQLSTGGDFFYPNQYLRVDNTDLTPAQAAERIAEHLRIAIGRDGRSDEPGLSRTGKPSESDTGASDP